MAERLISPGVFTRENDQSFLAQGVAEIGAAFIGPTLKGPAFRPITVTSQTEFVEYFGENSPDFYTPYSVREYLKESSQATIVRILGLSGYNHTTVKSLVLYITGSGSRFPVGVIHPSRTGVTLPTGSIGVGTSPTQFTLVISGANGQNTFNSMSIDPTSTRYFARVLGTTSKTGQDGYVYAAFPKAADFISGSLQGSGSIQLEISSTELMLSGSTYGTYRNARTPQIRSQLIGSTRYNLFKAFTLSDGNAANSSVKLSIASIRPNPAGTGYGTFSILVRKFADTDARVEVLEQFDNLTLDATSVNYVARRIGTSRPVIDANGDVYLDGEWPNISKYIYLEMDSGVEDVPAEALPYSFAPLATPVALGSVPAPGYITTRYSTPAGGSTPVANNKVYYGFDYDDPTGLAYLNPTPSGSVNSSLTTLLVGVHPSGSNEDSDGGPDIGFDLLTMLSSSDTTDITPNSAYSIRKFTVPFQGGFDGQNPAVNRYTGASIISTNTQGFDLSDSSADGAQAYSLAIDTLRNPDAYDLNMLVMPGVLYNQHPYIAQKGIDLCEQRADCFFIMDADTLDASITSAITAVQSLDTSYAGVYFPWMKILDVDTNRTVWVPPSVLMPSVYAFNDRVAAEWYAAAGLNRGGISQAIAVRKRLNVENRDDLYEGRINPIRFLATQGIVAWGQKTLQQRASALDRINVRRLLIAAKKFIASASQYLVFEQNVESTRQRFLSIVNPYLASVQERNGLYAFRVIMDETNNTPDVIDRNKLVGKIFLQPTKTAEFIELEFNIQPTGATFED